MVTVFWSPYFVLNHFVLKPNIYQHRLGTNKTGKAAQNKGRFRFLQFNSRAGCWYPEVAKPAGKEGTPTAAAADETGAGNGGAGAETSFFAIFIYKKTNI